jgi:allantoinase
VSGHKNIAVKSSRIVTPEGEVDGLILIDGGRIQQVTKRLDSGFQSEINESTVMDFGDLVVSPGVVDAHVHVNDPPRPGSDPWEGFESATAAAAAGGVTTIIDMPLNSIPVTTSFAALEQKRSAAAGNCHVDVGFYGGLVEGNRSELCSLIEQGVCGLKAFMCESGLAEFPAATELDLRAGLESLKSTGIPLLVHAELVDGRKVSDTSDSPNSYSRYANSRPPTFETAAIEMLIKLCREYRTPIHIVHLATAAALPMIKSAKEEGLPITVETCPHYLYFSESEIGDGQTMFKCAPPIRDEENRLALCEAVQSGLIETVGSDHSPCPAILKLIDEGDFENAWGGISGLQLSLPVLWTVGRRLGWTTDLMAQRLATRPAEIFGLADRKGKIAAGFDADLTVWDPDKTFVVRGENLHHRHPITPYEGRELYGVTAATFVRGKQVFRDDRLTRDRNGELLRPSKFVSACTARFLNGLDAQTLRGVLESCCASKTWIEGMTEGGPFRNDESLLSRGESNWQNAIESDWLEAFSAHPRIGDVESLREKYANTKRIAGGEQSGVDSADDETLNRLAAANDEYFEKFGFIFIVCATGKSANEMLEILESRLPNDRESELRIAAAEQLKITKIRIRKLV